MKTILALTFFLVSVQLTIGQSTDTAFVHHIFESEAFGEDRKITVHLPSRYLDNPDEAMMVTYVLDAQGPQYFQMLVANLDYLTSRYGIIPTIVVGIHSKNRFAEFTPFARKGSANEGDNRFESKLPNLYQHLEQEVFPWVEANFRTKPFRAIVGHSRGGSFVLQALFDGHEQLFDAYLAISPALGFDNFQTIDVAAERLKSKAAVKKFLYCSSGDAGDNEKFFKLCVDKLDTVINAHPNHMLTYHRRLFMGKDHFTTVAPSLTLGMVLLKNAHMVSLENIYEYATDSSKSISSQMDQFIQEKKTQNQFLHEPSPRYYSYLAGELFEAADYKNALDLFLWVEKRSPTEKWWELLNMGICYSYLGNKETASRYFDKSLLKLENYKEQYAERFEQIKNDVKKQIEEYSSN